MERSMEFERVSVIGAGAWGTALAQTLTLAGRKVVLWTRRAEHAAALARDRANHDYLPGARLDPRIEITSDLARAAEAEAIVLVVPAQHLRGIAATIGQHAGRRCPAIICAKGIEQASGLMLDRVLAEAWPAAIPAVLSGPSFAADVVRGLPAAVTLACADETLGRDLAIALGYRHFRIYWTNDLIGVGLGGAMKNVLAIAAGIVEGRGLGASAHAAMVTRGFAELRRLGEAVGARPETLMGLSGLGDLLLSCGSSQSRNMSLGRALGEGQALAAILGSRRSVTEGVATAAAAQRLAAAHNVDMPITAAVAGVVAGTIGVDIAIESLLSRPFKAEA